MSVEMRPQLFIPGGTFHTSRLAPNAGYAFLASTEWPGVEPPDVEHGDIEALVEAYPDFSEEIRAFTALHYHRSSLLSSSQRSGILRRSAHAVKARTEQLAAGLLARRHAAVHLLCVTLGVTQSRPLA